MTVQVVDGQVTLQISADRARVTISQATGPQGPTGPTGATGPAYEPGQILAATAGAYTYLGKAAVGVAEDDDGWTIARFSAAGGTITTEHATGAWVDRASLTYT